jgi:hypothetical protein
LLEWAATWILNSMRVMLRMDFGDDDMVGSFRRGDEQLRLGYAGVR